MTEMREGGSPRSSTCEGGLTTFGGRKTPAGTGANSLPSAGRSTVLLGRSSKTAVMPFETFAKILSKTAEKTQPPSRVLVHLKLDDAVCRDSLPGDRKTSPRTQ